MTVAPSAPIAVRKITATGPERRVSARRGHGEGSVYRYAANGTWVGAISLGWRPDGSRIRRKVTGRTKTEIRDKLKKLQAEADAGLKTSASYTLSKAVDDWAAEALDGLAAKTVRSHVDLLRPVTILIGNIPLRDLTAHDVRRALNKLAETRSTRTMASTHNVLVRAIRHAEANDHVGRNVASFVKPPQGKTGRPSRAMTAAQAAALLAAAKDHHRLGAYVILSLTTGIRTEEASWSAWRRRCRTHAARAYRRMSIAVAERRPGRPRVRPRHGRWPRPWSWSRTSILPGPATTWSSSSPWSCRRRPGR
ncbi:MAG: hypothetical protein ACRDOH_30245 [Streptosporangiaceae bacterium]